MIHAPIKVDGRSIPKCHEGDIPEYFQPLMSFNESEQDCPECLV